MTDQIDGTAQRGPDAIGPTYTDRVADAVRRHGPLVAGLDPTPGLLEAWGLPDNVEGLRRFTDTMLTALADQVAWVKPQSAYFERHGASGVAVLEEALATLRGSHTLSLMDAKRSDIGSTLEAYAHAYLADGAPMAADAITLSPYLGYGSLAPAISIAAESSRGVFVLALTSNPEGAQLQHHGSPPVAATIVEEAARDNATRGESGPNVGVVVGATIGSAPADLGMDLAALGGWILAPGLGAQGARPEDLPVTFGDALPRVLPVVSRALAALGPDPDALRAGAREWNERLASVCSRS